MKQFIEAEIETVRFDNEFIATSGGFGCGDMPKTG